MNCKDCPNNGIDFEACENCMLEQDFFSCENKNIIKDEEDK